MKLLTSITESICLVNTSHIIRQACVRGFSSQTILDTLKRLEALSLSEDPHKPDDMSWDEYLDACSSALTRDLMSGRAMVKWWSGDVATGASKSIPACVPVEKSGDDKAYRQALCAAFLVNVVFYGGLAFSDPEKQVLLTPQASKPSASQGAWDINTDVGESEQMSTAQNATLHGVIDGVAASLSVTPCYPEYVKNQYDAVAYLTGKMAGLVAEGWDVSVTIGPDLDAEENDSDFEDC